MTTPQLPSAARTSTVPAEQRVDAASDQNVVFALLHCETDTLHPLPKGQKRVTVGSAPDRDIVVPSPFVSKHHCRLERKGLVLRVIDEASKNGTFFEGKQEKSFVLKPGKSFLVGVETHRLVALDEAMHAHYAELTGILGLHEEHVISGNTLSPTDMLLVARQGGRLLITSEPHCEQRRLAQIIHKLSRLRARDIVEPTSIPTKPADQTDLIKRRARRSTLVLDIADDATPIDPTFASMLFSWRNQVRVIALARTADIADEALGKHPARTFQQIWLPPLAVRPAAVRPLLDRMFMERNCPLRLSFMTQENQDALLAYEWPDNFASLRQAADWLVAIVRAGSIPKAATELGVARATLYHWYAKNVGLSYPLIPVSAALRTPS